MAYVMILLIAVAVSFPAGWLVCRAWLNASGTPAKSEKPDTDQHKLLQAQRRRYRGQVQRIVEVVRRHESARDQLVAKLAGVGDRLENSQRHNAQLRIRLKAAMDELKQRREDEPLREPADTAELEAERNELRARIHQLEEQTVAVDEEKTRATKAEQRAERGELREKLAAAEHRRHELGARLVDRESRIEQLEEAVESWKRRVIPLTRQVQQYREAVHKLQKDASTAPDNNEDLRPDALQQIKGIGPALERRLNAQGIRRFEQIATLASVDLANLADKLAISPALPERDEWIEQARKLADADAVQTAGA